MIIWLASYPRSGNTFFRLLLHQLYGIKTYSTFNDPELDDLGASKTIGHQRLPASLSELEADSRTFIVKTHDLPSDDKPAIYLVRDGRDSIVSFARFIRSFPVGRREKLMNFVRERIFRIDTFLPTLEDLIANSTRFGGWSGHIRCWLRRPTGKTVLIRYEDLIADPIAVSKESIDKIAIPSRSISSRVPAFKELHEKWPALFRKGKVGTWREEMPHRLQTLFWAKHGHTMRELGYNE